MPTSSGAAGDGRAEARQLDAVLLQVGFKASKDLLDHVAGLARPAAYTKTIVDAVRGLLGRHLRHTWLASRLARSPAVVDAGIRAAGRDRNAFDTLVTNLEITDSSEAQNSVFARVDVRVKYCHQLTDPTAAA